MQQSGKSPPLCDTLRNTYFMCALNIGCDNPCRRVTDWWEGSKIHQGTFQTWWLFTTKRALELSSVVSRRTSWHTTPLQKKRPGGQEVSTSKGLFPAWWSYRQPHTPAIHSHKWDPLTARSKLRSLCLCRCLAAKTTTPLGGFRAPLRLTDKRLSLSALWSPSPSTPSLSEVDGEKAGNASWCWEKVSGCHLPLKKKPEEHTCAHLTSHKVWHVCRVMMGGVLLRVHGKLVLLVYNLWEKLRLDCNPSVWLGFHAAL